MQTKCDLCDKNCVCHSCNKNINCKFSTQEDCKICYECGRFEPFDYIKEIYRSLDRSRESREIREMQNILALKRDKMKREC